MPEHELAAYLSQDLAEMASEYERIRARTREDPGTAGDEGEQVWAQLLMEWLPEDFKVCVKGRILGSDGTAGPQVDVLVLRPGYPRRLLTKKLYLAAGVAAAFECKNTLKVDHIRRAWRTVAAINKLESETYAGTPIRELVPSIYYGILAHGHVWKGAAENTVTSELDVLLNQTDRMKDALSIICVANLACWQTLRLTYDGPGLMPPEIWEARKQLIGQVDDTAHCVIQYGIASSSVTDYVAVNPLGSLISNLIGRLAVTDSNLELFAQYFNAAGMNGSMGVPVASRQYTLHSQMPSELVARLPQQLINGPASEWAMGFPF